MRSMTRVVLVLMLAWGAGCGGDEEAHDEHEGESHDHDHDGVEDHAAEDHDDDHVAEVHAVAEVAAGTGPMTLSDQGVRFDPPVAENRIPDGAFYCDMGTVHFAALQRNDGRCPVCGMELKQMDASAPEHAGHDHPEAAGDMDHHDDDHAHDEGGMDHHDHDHE